MDTIENPSGDSGALSMPLITHLAAGVGALVLGFFAGKWYANRGKPATAAATSRAGSAEEIRKPTPAQSAGA